MKVKNIKEININEELIDITLKGNPTFWISENGNDFVLTHNSDAPDVDLDLDSNIHKTVESYLVDKYGIDKVCHIGNYLKFGAKTIVKDLSRVYELDYYLTNKLTSLFSANMNTSVTDELKQALDTAKKMDDKDLMAFIEDNYKIFKNGDRMVGMIRQSGRHASGILISDKKLNQSDIPVIKAKGELVTAVQEGMEDREVSELGYMKLDILGLTTAGIVNDTFKLVENKYGIKNLEMTLLKSNFDDEKVWEQFAIGNCQDIFQFGSNGMRAVIKDIGPNNIYELTAINSLYRPANIEANMIQEYIANRLNPEVAKKRINETYSGLYELLQETYGAIVYQEQIMFVLQEVGGFSLAESDKARKILKKLYKKGSESEQNPEFTKLINQFKQGAIKKGVSEANAELLLQTLSKYTGYTFNKSHSLAYSINAYVSMYLKVHYPLEYFSTLFNYSSQDDMVSLFKIASEQGIKFNDFIVNEVGEKFSVDYTKSTIKMGLQSVKGLPVKDIQKLLDVRINTLTELLVFVKEAKLGKKAIETLCRLGYFSPIHSNSKSLEDILFKAKALKKDVQQESLFPETGTPNDLDLTNDYTISEKLKYQLEYLGYYISEHPFFATERIARHIEQKISAKMYCPKEAHSKAKEILVYGVVTTMELKKTKSGKDYFNLTLEDDIKQIQIKVWDTSEVQEVKIGNSIAMTVECNKFGFSKSRKSIILPDLILWMEKEKLKPKQI